jgi:hypothetical protein
MVWLNKIRYSLPFQLLVNHVKKNQVMLVIWVVLFGFVSQQFGRWLGIPYLFLDPEYMGHVDMSSMFILGMSFGVFNMSFHLTSYILDSTRFSIIGTLPSPFIRFFQNNSIIPAVFLLVYFVSFFRFQIESGFENHFNIACEAVAFLLGSLVVKTVLLFYFKLSNKDIFKLLTSSVDNTLRRNKFNRVNVLKTNQQTKKVKYRVEYYYEFPFKLIQIDKTTVVEKHLLTKIFDQNHLNAVFIELFIFVLIIFFSQFNDLPALQIPAGASAFVFASFIVMLTGALSYWLRGWAISTIVILAVLANMLTKNGILKLDNEAFGINYEKEKADFSLENIRTIASDTNYKADVESTIQLLENWKAKFPAGTKPKMIFVCASGGGQRAAVWSLRTLQVVDEATKGSLMRNAMLMTGASGGMLGSAYFRELYLRKQLGEIPSYHDEKYVDNISKDVLNPLLFTFFVNDIFFRVRTVKMDGLTYTKDRGYAFEQILCRNTDNMMDKRLIDYKEPERKSLIPMAILSPTVVNDGRKLYISSQHVSYMCSTPTITKSHIEQRMKGIEFRRMFAQQRSDSLRFMSALRMSATFPYITPNVVLPSYPAMEIMDAGLSDNFGYTDAMRFLFVFREWISKNTSGVVLVSIRDSEKEPEIEKRKGQTIFEKFMNPIGSLYNNWDMLQDINNDNLADYAKGWFNGPFDVVTFEYIPKSKHWDEVQKRNLDPNSIEKKERQERASLSWHLTTREKESIKRTVFEDNNVNALTKLKTLLRQTDTASVNRTLRNRL